MGQGDGAQLYAEPGAPSPVVATGDVGTRMTLPKMPRVKRMRPRFSASARTAQANPGWRAR